MTVRVRIAASMAVAALSVVASTKAAEFKVDLSKEQVGKPPTTRGSLGSPLIP